MKLPGTRFRTLKLVHTDRFIIEVEVEWVIPDFDPSEPCLESETVAFLKQVHERADRGDVAWLQRHGKVYQALQAAVGAA